MTAAAVPYLMAASTAVAAYSAHEQGKAQSRAAEAQAQQAESEAKSQLVERKRALIKTMAAQNVGAAAQGRTISSISALQEEDVRRAGYDQTLIKGGAAQQASAYRASGASAKRAGTISATSSLLSGATQYAQTKTP